MQFASEVFSSIVFKSKRNWISISQKKMFFLSVYDTKKGIQFLLNIVFLSSKKAIFFSIW